MKAMCSRTGRAATHSARRFRGESNEVHHLVATETMKSLCGRDASEWIDMEDAFESSIERAAANVYCCRQCGARYTRAAIAKHTHYEGG